MSHGVSRRVIAQVVTKKLIAEPSRQRHWLRSAAAYLLANGRVHEVDQLANDIALELSRHEGTLLVEVTTARKMSSTLQDYVSRELRVASGAKRVVMNESIDADLLGGFIARTPDATYDASVRHQLQQLAAYSEERL